MDDGKVINQQNASTWLYDIASDNNYWQTGVFEEYPSVIAYEYFQLHELCRNYQPFGVLLALKDNFEALIKYETLISYAWTARTNSGEYFQNTISRLTTPNLSMGAWVELALLLLKDLKSNKIKLPEMISLEKIVKFYQKNQIVNWRNSHIGHGAIGLAEDKEFQDDIKHKIKLLKEVYLLVENDFSEQQFCMSVDDERCINENKIVLKGARLARNLQATGKLYVMLDNVSVELDPFIVIRKHDSRGFGIYFFDNQKTTSLTMLQAYAEGSRKNESISYFEQLRRKLDLNSIDLKISADDKYLTEDESHNLDLQQMSHRFIEPVHLISWLRECLANHEKGVFCLQMNRGTGKSVFTEKLNRLYEKPLIIDDEVDVRTYHFGRTQSAGSNDFISRIEWLWMNEYRGKGWSRIPHINEYEKNGKNKIEALCSFLSEVRNYSERNRGYNKILMILDGVDEIADKALMDYIPSSELLDEGVYILLTSRDVDKEEVLPFVKNSVQSLVIDDSLVYERTSDEYTDFLYDYIKKATTLGKITDSDKKKLIELADGRVLYLGMLCKLMEIGKSIKELPESSEVASSYFRIVLAKYGSKEAVRLKELLSILCAIAKYDPLTINEISSLMYENGVTLEIIGMLRDLVPLLKVERTERGNTYCINNPDVRDSLMPLLPEIKENIENILSYAFSLLCEESLDDADDYYNETIDSYNHKMLIKHTHDKYNGTKDMANSIIRANNLEVLFAHISDLKIAYTDKFVLTKDHEKAFREYVCKSIVFMSSVNERKRTEELTKQLYLFEKEFHGDKAEETVFALYMLYSVQSINYNVAEGETLCSLYSLAEETYGIKHPVSLFILSRMLNILNENVNFGYEELLKKTEEIQKQIIEYNDDISKVTLAEVEEGIAWLDYQHGKFQTALLHMDNSISLWKKIKDRELDLAATLDNKADILSNVGRYENSLVLLQQAYEIQKKYPESISHVFDTAKRMGNILISLQSYQKAYEILKECYEWRLKNYGENHANTLITLGEIFEILIAMKRRDEAIITGEKVCTGYKEIWGSTDEDYLYFAVKLLDLYMESDGKQQEALTLSKELYELTANERDESAATIVIQYAKCLLYSNQLKKGKKLLENTIPLFEENFGNDNKNLHTAYILLAGALHQEGKKTECIDILEKTYQKMEKLFGSDDAGTVNCMELLVNLYAEILLENKEDKEIQKKLGILFPQFQKGKKSLWKKENPGTIGRVGLLLKLFKRDEMYRNVVLEQKLHGFIERFEKSNTLSDWYVYKEHGLFIISMLMMFTMIVCGQYIHISGLIMKNSIIQIPIALIGAVLVPCIFSLLLKMPEEFNDAKVSSKTKLVDSFFFAFIFVFMVVCVYVLVFNDYSSGGMSFDFPKSFSEWIHSLFPLDNSPVTLEEIVAAIKEGSSLIIISLIYYIVTVFYLSGIDYIVYKAYHRLMRRK